MTASDEITRLHTEAEQQNCPVYRDPITGRAVFTSQFLLSRDYCCEGKCRHCPYKR